MIDILKTERLELKPLSISDRDTFIEILTNPSVGKTYMIPEYKNIEDYFPVFEKFMSLSNSNNHFVYGIYLFNRLIGWINEVDRKEKEIELGYVMDPSFQNRGYMTESMKMSIKTLFNLGFNAVIAGFFEENISSRRVLEKVEMSKIDKEEIIEYRGSAHKCFYYSKRTNR